MKRTIFLRIEENGTIMHEKEIEIIETMTMEQLLREIIVWLRYGK